MVPTVLRKLAKASRNYDLTWRYLFNFAPTISYKFNRHTLSGEAARVLNDLNRDGVAVTSAQALLGPDSCFNELSEAVDVLERKLANQLTVARAAVSEDVPAGMEKKYIFPLLGDRPVLDASDVHVRFALQKPILQIANAYYGMYTRLGYYNVWHTFTTQGNARQSQLWHTDRDDLHYVFKVFVNLSDVDDAAGPFTYATGTHHKRKPRREPAYLFKEGNTPRSSDAQMAEIVPPERWVKSVGPKGTIIFADTHGYHKGGLAREHERIMYTCMFTSPFAHSQQARELFERRGNISLPTDKEQAFALASSRPEA